MLMLSPKEYVARECPETVFFYMPELVRYLFTATMRDSWKGGNGNSDRLSFHRDCLTKEMKKGTHDAEDLNQMAESFEPKKRHKEFDSDSGTFDVGRYLDGDETPFTDVFTIQTERQAVTILMEMGASWADRDDTETYRKRHLHAYAEVLKAEAQGIPVRVIACHCDEYSDVKGKRKFYSIIKDYGDPIFPEIWGCLRSGATANSTVNLISYTMIGTHDPGNGWQQSFDVDEDFPEDEQLVLIDPNRARSSKAKVIQTTK